MSTTIVVGAPPEFAADGTWPPLRSKPVFVGQESVLLLAHKPAQTLTSHKRRWAAIAGVTSLLTAGIALIVWVPTAAIVVVRRKRAATRWARLAQGSDTESEIRTLVYSQQWVRDDPIIQLPPGTSQEKQFTVTSGMAGTHMQELAKSLNLGSGELTNTLSSKVGFEVKVSTEVTRTETLTLQNDNPDKYRLYARWSVVHRLDVFRIPLPSDVPSEMIEELLANRTEFAAEAPFLTIETIDQSSTNFTSIDLRRPSQASAAV
jgi:hypothetical protein